jgi:branched-subunit amino acid aminotransferase/4-amino-4-deoxychorismate lyase
MTDLDGKPITIDQIATLALAPYGHFTSMRVDDRKVRGLALHMERLSRDCRTLYGADLDLDKVRTYVRQALADISGSVVVRVTIFDPSLELGHPGAATDPHILVTTRPAAMLPLPALRVQSARYIREDPPVKHVGLYGTLHLRRIAQQGGYDDVLFVDDAGLISEGATWNIGFIDGERVIWPQADVLAGVTMRLLTEAYPRTTTAPVHLHDLPEMAAVFATNTTIGVRPISMVNEVGWSDEHAVITRLQDQYSEIEPDEL